jgi:hypothetical protein
MASLEANGIRVFLVKVGYEFQKGATKMPVEKNVSIPYIGSSR